MVFDMNNTDILSNLFGNLSFDIQEKIYGEVLYSQEVKKTKDKYKKVMYELQEVMYKSFDYKKELNSVFEFLDCGKRVVGECSNGCVEVEVEYDRMYYDNLDYLLMCDIDTEINIEVDNIGFNYKLKDNYSWLRNYYDKRNYINDSEEYYEFRYDINSMNYNLYDFCDCDIGEYDSMLEEILEDNFNTTTNEELKSLLYMCSMRKLFYGKLDKYEDIILF